MSEDYRNYGDSWRTNSKVKDEPFDVSVSFSEANSAIQEIAKLLETHEAISTEMEEFMLAEMAKVVFGSNQLSRLGLGLDETFKVCMKIFNSDFETKWDERSEVYQEKLDKFVLQATRKGEDAVIRSRRELVQHAAALQHIINSLVRLGKPMTEELLKETHRILTKDLDPVDSGNFNTQSFGGIYRQGDQKAFGGAHEFTKPAAIPRAMKAMIKDLQNDMAEVEATTSVDPFMLVSKYCDRLVNIHPFKDGNGRMSRLLMNALLLKYGGCVVPLGEKGEDRDLYLEIAQESAKVGSHAGQLGKLVLERAGRTLKRFQATLSRQRKF